MPKRYWEKLKSDLDAWEAEKKGLQRQLEEALAKVEADAAAGAERVAQAKGQGYQQDHIDTLGYLRKVFATLAQEF